MDPIKVPSPPSNTVKDRSSRFSLRRLWQVPVFFVGVAAFLTILLTRGLIAPDPVRRLHHDLAEARRLLEKEANDPDAALRHAQQAVDTLACDQGRAAEAFFLLGSAHLCLAERLSPEFQSLGAEGNDSERRVQSSERRAQNLEEARRCLQEAERRGLDAEDGNRLQYRLAKLSFYLGEDTDQVIEKLKASVDAADDRAEALTLLSRAYLRLKPPNLKEALKANKKLREEVPQIGEDVLGPAKLAGAKLLLQLNQNEEARKTLEKISDRAAPTVLAEKNILLAGLYQEERKWSDAVEKWQAVLDDKRMPLAEAGGVLYNLGICYRNLEQNSKAMEAWSECMRRSQGEEAQAAALELAGMHLHEANSDKAVSLLAEAVAQVRKADDWKNSLRSLANVREAFEQAMSVYRQGKRFVLAIRTAELYERVAVPPKAQLRRAELNSEWAKILQERARSIKDEATRKKEETAADELLRQAAEAHAETAKLLTEKTECADHLWLSAVCSYEGHDYRRAADKLREIVEREKDNGERLSEGLFMLGETCRHLHDFKAAETAYKMCAECGTRYTYRARYELAMLEIKAGNIDSAEGELEQNIHIEQRESDSEAQEKSRLALCALQYQKAESLPQYYRKVVQLLEGHIDHFPLTAESVRARYQLADSYRRQVDPETRDRNALNINMKSSPEALNHYLALSKRSWTRAQEEFAKLEELIKEPELAKLLSLKEQVEIPFLVAKCYYYLGEYEKALHKYEDLAKKWGHSQQALYALGQTMCCYSMMGKYKEFYQRADDVRARLATTEGLSDNDKKHWIEWLTKATKDVEKERNRTSSNEQPTIIQKGQYGRQHLNQNGPVLEMQRR